MALTADVALDGTSHPLDPRVRVVWAVVPAAVWGVLLLLVLVAFAVNGHVVGSATSLVLLVLSVGGLVGWARLAYARWRWAAFPDALEVRHGVVRREISLVPYHRIQQIDVRRGPIERLLGLSTLVLRTAAATTDAEVPGIRAEHADALRLALLRRAGVDDAV